MITALAIAIGTTCAASLILVPVLLRVRRLRTSMLAIATLGIVIVVVAILGAGLVMFSRHDLIGLTVVAIAAALIAGAAGILLATRVTRTISHLRAAGDRLAGGDLAARVPVEGPDELREVAVSFNEMAAGLTRLFETRRNLVAWASHDLRAPLASLQAMIEALEDGLVPVEQYLPMMRGQVHALALLVDDLFELSRIETGALALAIDEVRMSDVVAECVASLRPVADRQGVHLEVADQNTGVLARCDPTLIDRVLRNLLTNALRHTPSDGGVLVRVAKTRSAVRVDVEDSGPGIPEGASERVFESFWRADPARSPGTGGAGLGLAIARGIVIAHGGNIWAENRPEGGARFAFTLPAA